MEEVIQDETIAEGSVRTTWLDREEVLSSKKRYWFWKRTQDIILASMALLMLWPLMLVIAVLIVLDSPGKPIFVQERVGRDGKHFKLYKFRSMVNDAESMLDDLMEQNEMDGPAFKITDDPRITRIGHFIRKTSIDELPQLWNVLKGDMSLVGPRPPLPREVMQYDEHQLQRLYVTPGLSCYWQIQPDHNSLSFDEWLELDLKYIKERSFLVDWKIVLGTFCVVFGMNGK